MLDPRIMRAGFIAAKQLLALSAGVALHDASERPWTFRTEEHRPCWPTAIDAFRASLWPLQLAPGRTLKILPGDFRQGFAERAQTPLAHDAFGMTDPTVSFIHSAILNPPAQLNPCAQIVPTICVSGLFDMSGTTQNQQLTCRQYGAEERPPLPAPQNKYFIWIIFLPPTEVIPLGAEEQGIDPAAGKNAGLVTNLLADG